MKGGKRPLGYTIIEVMIVLVISGFMFLIAADFIGGKQQATAFTQGLSGMSSDIQNIIDQVTAGQYSDIGLSCTSSGGITTVTAGSSPQGTEPACDFLGKMMRFTGPGSPDYEVISLAGAQVNPAALQFLGVTTTPQQFLADSGAAVITPLTTSQTTSQQLEVTGMCVTPTGSSVCTNQIYTFGFIENLGSPDGTGSYESGAQPLSMIYSPVTALPREPDINIDRNVFYAQSATICLANGPTGAHGTLQAKIIVGSSNNQLGVTVQRLATGTPCP
jgi:prepilin-type N-terminal cleavage/methylation domain-containing protein